MGGGGLYIPIAARLLSQIQREGKERTLVDTKVEMAKSLSTNEINTFTIVSFFTPTGLAHHAKALKGSQHIQSVKKVV